MEFTPLTKYPSYEMSKNGTVRNVATGKIKAIDINNRGYKSVHLYENGKVNRKQIHVLLAEQFIPNPSNKTRVDHIDKNKLNNDLNNLRWATISENAMNCKIPKDNTSGCKGVWKYTHKKTGKITWIAEIRINGKKKTKHAKTKEDAIKARKQLEEEYFGEFA